MTDMEDTQRRSDICISGQQIRWSFFYFFHFSNEEADVCEGEGLQGQKTGMQWRAIGPVQRARKTKQLPGSSSYYLTSYIYSLVKIGSSVFCCRVLQVAV